MSVTLPASLERPWPRPQDFEKKSNYLPAVLSEYLRAPLAWSCRRWSGADSKPPRGWRSGLILGPSHIGDVLYNTATLPLLRESLPDCQWTYLASGLSGQVLENNRNLHEVISIEETNRFSSRLRLTRARLAGRRFDAALAYARGSWQDLSLAALLRIPNRAGYVHKGFSGLVTHPLSIRIPQPFPAYFRDLVAQLVDQPAEKVPTLQPLVYPLPRHEAAAAKLMARWGLHGAHPPLLACAVTSRQAAGVWPAKQFLAAVQHLRRQEACQVIYFGAPADAPQLRELADATGPGAHVLAGELELLAVVALLRRCRLALTSDSGPRHLASAAGIPVFFVRNLGFNHIEAGAYAPGDHDMAPQDLEFLTPAEQAVAFERIDPATVGEEMIRVWREIGATKESRS